MNQDIDGDESELVDPPNWMALISILVIVAGFLLLCMGIMGKM